MGKKGGFQKQIHGQYEIQCEKQMANHIVFSFISNSRTLLLSVFLFLSDCQCSLATHFFVYYRLSCDYILSS